MNVISKHGLTTMVAKRPEAENQAFAWYRVARKAAWHSLEDVRVQFPSADLTGNALIFNIRHNRYRLITKVSFQRQEIYIKALLTHKEYDREEWKKWA